MIDSNSLDRVAKAVREVGFPITVASVLLWAFLVRQPAEMQALRDAIDRNTQALAALQSAVRR
jgi:hypothetical protein